MLSNICENCGKLLDRYYPAPVFHCSKTTSEHIEPKERNICEHRGEILGKEDCECRTAQNVYACKLFNYCTPKLRQVTPEDDSLTVIKLPDGKGKVVRRSVCATCNYHTARRKNDLEQENASTENAGMDSRASEVAATKD